MEPVYQFPIGDEEFEKLKAGEVLLKTYSPPLQPQIMYLVVVWNKQLLKTLDRDAFENALKAGINVANIPFTDKESRKLEEKGGIEVHFPFGKVLVSLASTFAEAQKLQEGS